MGLQVDRQHTLIKLVKVGGRFRSAILFDNLSWVLPIIMHCLGYNK
jgi:hypothetical protein